MRHDVADHVQLAFDVMLAMLHSQPRNNDPQELVENSFQIAAEFLKKEQELKDFAGEAY